MKQDPRSKTLIEHESVPDWFDADAYVEANPDVLLAIDIGEIESPFAHFVEHGQREPRPLFPPGREPRDRLIRTRVDTGPKAPKRQIDCHVEELLVSIQGAVYVVGWIDDRGDPIERITVSGPTWRFTFPTSLIARVWRPDAEQALGAESPYAMGFFAFSSFDTRIVNAGPHQIEFELRSGATHAMNVSCKSLDDETIRNRVLGGLAGAKYLGPHAYEPVRAIANGIGHKIIGHNRRVTDQIVAGAHAETFGDRNRPIKGSLIVCLYGKPEYLFLQSALFHGRPGFEDYEIVYVSNSPELGERLLKEARAAERIYDIPTTLVLLAGNAGFGAANNLAIRYARSDRILVVNPDVFPRDPSWAAKHSALVNNLSPDQTRIFGALLYYDDGSLMHGGMYLEFDKGISIAEKAVAPMRLLRVEHYGKGTPAKLPTFTASRPVPAVTGAFISMDRRWFETLGGFTEDFVFGHYEDADLCLKSLNAGTPAWIHDLRLWHLEGKGSTRLPVHEGGSIVNRGLFSERWSAFVADGVEGQCPGHPLLARPTAVAPSGSDAMPKSKAPKSSATGPEVKR